MMIVVLAVAPQQLQPTAMFGAHRLSGNQISS
jgi:hypothetical protein